MYRHAQHTINVFVVPAADTAGGAAPRRASVRGFHTVRWVQGGMAYWAVSDVDAVQLEKLSGLLREDGRRARTRYAQITRRSDPFSRAERVHADSLTQVGTSSARERTGEQEALHAVAAELAQLRQRRVVLDAARDDGEAELVRELDRRADDQRVARVLRHAHR